MIMGHNRTRTIRQKRARAGLLFTIPFLVGFFLFFLIPVIQSVFISFQSIKASESGMKVLFVGLENYKDLFISDPDYIPELVSSFTNLLIDFPCILLFSFFIATILNQSFKGRVAARVLFFLPVIIASGVIQLIQSNQLQSVSSSSITSEAQNTGMVQMIDVAVNLVNTIKIDPAFIDFVNMAVERAYTITISSGIQILIFLAGLQTISPSLFEASAIEGATGWENFWKITFPMISPLILVNAVYTIIDSMGGLLNPTIMRIHNTSFVLGNYGYAAAMSWVYFIGIVTVLIVFIFLSSKKVYYED